MIAIVDYGVGNLFSLKCSFAAIGVEVQITCDREILEKADGIILPGVGAFDDAAKKLRESGIADLLRQLVEKGKPLMGICLGMQLLFDESHEYGVHEGLGIIKGKVKCISEFAPAEYKIPQIGWNLLRFPKPSPLFKYIKEGDYVYFVHSYCACECDDAIIAYTEYGAKITAAVQYKNVFGCQFHPEKSGEVGLKVLKAFSEMREGRLC
ncbi:MAG: imidazole glycerol phosphate synthase subunit HisH [Clostridia bacterium]|nr:imidazole glycerol phosphate synthase subunit HisH [Clostridia bacterium]